MDRPAFATRAHDCILGVDVGKLSRWACAVARDGEELPSGQVTNTEPDVNAGTVATTALGMPRMLRLAMPLGRAAHAGILP